MFEVPLRDAVTEIDATLRNMIWRVVDRYAALTAAPSSVPASIAYGMLDGLFQQALLGYLGGARPHWTASWPKSADDLLTEAEQRVFEDALLGQLM